MLLGNGGDGEGGVLICFCFLYYNDERDEGQTLWFALVWKILSKRGWEKEGGYWFWFFLLSRFGICQGALYPVYPFSLFLIS